MTNPFDRLDDFLDLRRLSGLALSPAGDRLVVTVAALNDKRNAYVNALWEVDPAGTAGPRRLTWSRSGESDPVFLPNGDLLFLSARPDSKTSIEDDEAPAALWLLPSSGEARPVVSLPGGVHGVAVARDQPVAVFAGPMLPASNDPEHDGERRKERKEGKVSAVLHDSYPIRFWDHDLGPARDRLFTVSLAEAEGEPEEQVDPTDLTGHVGQSLGSSSTWSVSPAGDRAVVTWRRLLPAGTSRETIVLVDLATGERTVVLDDPDFDYLEPAFSPDGTKVALIAERRSTPSEPPDSRPMVLHLAGGELHDAAPGWDRWATGLVWAPDGSALYATADENGRGPVFRLDLDSRTAVRLTADDAAYSAMCVSRDGTALYAVRAAVDSLPTPVRLSPSSPDQVPELLRGPVVQPMLPGTVEEVTATAADGTALRSWLVLPSSPGPHPLLLWVHGGPLNSWNGWHWRWNPWLAVARGYAVLLPDPALSTGYGLAGIKRGWGRWGFESYDDLMTLTDAAVTRPDVDAEKTAALGGSYGGYMANWIAGHTERFRGIVSHAGLWDLAQFGMTTDASDYWVREMTESMAHRNSPSRASSSFRTPMLVIHGDRDYRVPIGEGLALWTALARHNESEDGVMRHRFLLFPDENHWILKPQQSKVWYETIFAFLDHTVHGKAFEPPELLR